MKKLLLICFILILFTSCGVTVNNEIKDKTDRIIGIDENLCNGGELFADDKGRLNFYDFTSMQSAILCSRPNCPHTDSEVCSSYGLGNMSVLYGKNIWCLQSRMEYDNGKSHFNTDIVRADTDGTGRVTLKTIKDRSVKGINILLSGDTLYFDMSKCHFDDFGSSSSYYEEYLCSYNLATNEFYEITKAVEGYNAGLTVIGIFDGKLYYNTSFVEEEIPWQEYMNPDFDLGSLFITQSYTYDPKSGKIEEIDKYPIYARDGVLVLSDSYDSHTKTLVRDDGSRADISYLSDFDAIVNGYIFSRAESLAVEVSSGRKFALLSGQNNIVKDYIGGEYIIKRNKMEDGNIVGREYIKLPAEELIGDEISYAKNDETKPENDTIQNTSPVVDDTKAETEAETIKWGDTKSPLAKEYWSMSEEERVAKDKENCLKYKELLGITSRKDANQLGYTFAGDYYLTTYCIGDLHSVGYVIDTNYSEACKIEIMATEINLDTGEEKALEASADGNMGAHLAVFADDGFIIKSYTITSDFPSMPVKIEVEHTDSLIENELFLEKLDSMSPEEQDAYLEEIYKQKLKELYNKDGE